MPNPIGFIGQSAINLILVPWSATLFALAAGGVVAMVLRYRRGLVCGEESNQVGAAGGGFLRGRLRDGGLCLFVDQ